MASSPVADPPGTKRRDVTFVLKKYWGYDQLRPLQAEAIEAGIEEKDSLVVLPTGGGKSLCYQVPPAVTGRTDVVVSPLISLMKDQVDALRAAGYPAAALHSGISEEERRSIASQLLTGRLRLLFVSPERLLTPWFISLLQRANVQNFAIDEAHCISQWGHDFRPEYRRLSELREHFPEASLHAFTATATERVRRDIIGQLKLRQPRVLVGRFDRPNLTYRVVQRINPDVQLVEAVRNHKDEAVIVYCISRADTERIADLLKAAGFRAAAYHAGMEPRVRAATQDAFAKERLDVVVATVAFGMGIDRSNVRCVIHAAMPKSVEHYQQETGRAGRDGLEAECVLFYGNGDPRRWESLMSRGAGEGQPAGVLEAQIELAREMNAFCTSHTCRHKALSVYFGQEYEARKCGACDVCFSDTPILEKGTQIARQVVDCVHSLRFPFGVGYVVDVLRGVKAEKISARRHDELSAYGALSKMGKPEVQSVVMQMVERGLLHRSSGERPVLTVTPEGRKLGEGKLEVELRAPAAGVQRAAEAGWDGVDRGLFEALRDLRRSVAEERSVPPFVIFSDATLRDLARMRPVTLSTLTAVKGVGERKQADFGERFVELIARYCREHNLSSLTSHVRSTTPARPSSKNEAFRLFDEGRTLDEVAGALGRSRGTVASYLEEYVDERRPESVAVWVADGIYERVTAVAAASPGGLLKPVFEALDGSIPYDDIRIVMKHAGLR